MEKFLVKFKKASSSSKTNNEQSIRPTCDDDGESSSSNVEKSIFKLDDNDTNLPICKKLKVDEPSISTSNQIRGPLDISACASDGPKQPMLNFPRRNISGKQRSFQSFWYSQYSWIEYSIENDAVFCFFCRHFSNLRKEVLTSAGYNDWKNIRKMAEKHENSNAHKLCLTKYKGWLDSQKTGAVSVKINEQMAQTVEKNRETLKTLVRSALFCARQGIALRGHREVQPGKAHEDPDDSDDSNDLLEDRPESMNHGNFQELVNLLCMENSQFNSNLKNLPGNAKYTSKTIQNDLLDAASNVVTRSIVNEIKSSNIYSIIVDEARDEGKKEQMSICCRYIHQAKIKERFLGFVELQELTAESLAIKILSFLESNGLDIKNCVSQSFDGASVMSGKLNGVQTLIREMAKNPCPYVHCHAHRLNLVLVDVAKNVQIVRETIGLLEAIYAFQSSSTLRHELFIFFKETKTGKKSITVPQHSDTRWVAKYKGVEFFKNNLDSVINALKKCTESSKPREAAEARGLLIQIQSFNVAFTLVSLEGVLKIVNILSKQLQSSTIDVGKCRKLVKATRDQLDELRSDAKFESFFQETAQLCNDCEIDYARARDTGRRKQNPTASLDDYFVMETTGKGRYTQKENPKTTLKAEYFHILDNMICEMDKRFAENDISIACISACNPKSHDFLDPKVLCNFSELHGKD